VMSGARHELRTAVQGGLKSRSGLVPCTAMRAAGASLGHSSKSSKNR